MDKAHAAVTRATKLDGTVPTLTVVEYAYSSDDITALTAPLLRPVTVPRRPGMGKLDREAAAFRQEAANTQLLMQITDELVEVKLPLALRALIPS